MANLIKQIAGYFLIPATKWYLRKERKFKYHDISVSVRPGVFHPGFFSSTLFLLEFMNAHDVAGKSLLELGCGTGLISIACARKGATVTASDISPRATANAIANAESNGVAIRTINSDLFDDIPTEQFDWIIINPPYYNKTIRSEADYAWNCGEHFEYFRRLFDQLPGYMHDSTQVIIVFTKGCNIHEILAIAQKSHFNMELVRRKTVPFDGADYLFRVKIMSADSIQA